MNDPYFKAKAPFYKTARATIGCAHFKAGDIVSVRYWHTNTAHWFIIEKSEHGLLPNPVVYPHHHLTDFVL